MIFTFFSQERGAQEVHSMIVADFDGKVGIYMKIVVVRPPAFLRPLLRWFLKRKKD